MFNIYHWINAGLKLFLVGNYAFVYNEMGDSLATIFLACVFSVNLHLFYSADLVLCMRFIKKGNCADPKQVYWSIKRMLPAQIFKKFKQK